MDPGALMNEGSFSNVNVNLSSFNLPEIWQLPMNGGGGGSFEEPAGGLGLRMARFEHNLGLLADLSGPNREAVANDPMSLEQKIGHCRAKRQFDVVDESGNGVSTTCSGNGVNQCDGKRLKTSTCRDENRESKTEAEPSSGKSGEQNAQLPPEPPKQDYIHVRARRGQATDSHSLAERARREKISERMKILQDLVPGCNKVIGKAVVLDEIINYIQSLQHQVEFLSMKIEAVNSRICPTVDAFPSKDFDRQTYATNGMAFGSLGTREYSRGSSPEWLHMQLGGGGLEKTS